MTITLEKGNTSVVICHGYAYTGTVGKFIGPFGADSTSTTWKTAAQAFIGADSITPRGLGNASFELPLEVGIEFATEAAAIDFMYTWDKSLPNSGSSMTISSDSGKTFTYPEAEIQSLQKSRTGVYVLLNYKFLCSAPSTN